MDMRPPMTVLSAPGGPLEVSGPLKTILALVSAPDSADTIVYVAKGKSSAPEVRHFVSRLSRCGYARHKFIEVEMDYIASLYNTEGNVTRSDKSSTEKIAMELMALAISSRASDIHIRYRERESTKIWMRIHNDMKFIREEPEETGKALLNSIYNTADVKSTGFTITQAQDASINNPEKMPKGVFSIRIATMPTVNGSTMVLRLLYNDSGEGHNLEQQGYDIGQIKKIDLMLRRPTGMILISGPTGSGKSTTLKMILSGMMESCGYRVNLLTVEDPVEYPILGAVQSPITNANSAAERDEAYSGHIRAAMRADPDIIMISEIRDGPTASAGFRAALTGHQVWATVHANNSFGIIDRLVDIGLQERRICDPSIISGLISQRLVKELCPKCCISFHEAYQQGRISDDLALRVTNAINPEKLDKVNVFGNPHNCDHCGGHGVIGRTAVAEVVVPNEQLFEHIINGEKSKAMTYWRTHLGGKTMLEHAIEKIEAGLIDPDMAEQRVGPLSLMTAADNGFSLATPELISTLPEHSSLNELNALTEEPIPAFF